MPTPASAAPAVSRREFIRATALAGGGLALGFAWTPAPATAQPLGLIDGTDRQFTPNPFIIIERDGTVVILAKNPETGQGVRTSLPMIVAEELDVDFDQVVVRQADLRDDMGPQFAGGSRSTPDNYDRLRRAGAVARVMLAEAAALTWGVTVDEVQTRSGRVHHRPTGRSLGYGELVARAATLPVPNEADVPLKSQDEFRIIGSRVGGVDNLAIVTGQPLFGIDQTLPGLRYATYVKCPVHGGKVKSANLDEVRAAPGVFDAFILEGTDDPFGLVPGVAIVADSTWAAWRARERLRVEWDDAFGAGHGSRPYAEQAEALGAAPGTVRRDDGDVADAFARGPTVVEAAYSYPFLNHATMEPQGGVAWARDDGMEFWTTSQTPSAGRTLVSRTLGIPESRLKLHLIRAGGGFGRRLGNDYLVEVAAIAQRTAGHPVKLTWTREDELRHGFYRPAGWHFLRGAVDERGQLAAWHNRFVTLGYRGTAQPARSAGLSPNELPAGFIPNYRLEEALIATTVPTGPLRAPGSNGFAFVFQSFIDELAHAAGRDPVEFRLDLLGPDRVVRPADGQGVPYDTARMKGVVRLAAEQSGWGQALPRGEGRGVAFHFSHRGYCAVVAHVHVSPDGDLTVREVTTAIDIGPIINPSGADNQVQGSVIDALGMAWLQEVTFADGRAQQSNFHDYPLLRIGETPRIGIHYIQSDNPPTGLGEPVYPVVPPAVTNAIHAATGHRVRHLPLRRHDLAWH
jgi:isoquinoline 1-oxidoreductase subunit beta